MAVGRPCKAKGFEHQTNQTPVTYRLKTSRLWDRTGTFSPGKQPDDHPIIKTSFLRSIQQPCGQASFLLNAGPSKSASHKDHANLKRSDKSSLQRCQEQAATRWMPQTGIFFKTSISRSPQKAAAKKWIT